MRCKICEKTFRTPTKAMKEYQMCSDCGGNRFPTKSQVKIESKVEIKITHGLDKGKIVEGYVLQILTPGNWHYEGLMVDLKDGHRGRVQNILQKENSKTNEDHEKNNLEETEPEIIKAEKRYEKQINQNSGINKINQLISEALEIIRKNSSGVYKKILAEKLMLSKKEFDELLPRLFRIEDIVEEEDELGNQWLRSIQKKELKEILKLNSINQIEKINDEVEDLRQEIKESEKQYSDRIQIEQAREIEKITTKMVEEYLQWKYNIIKQLKFTVITEYQKYRSLSKIYEMHSNDTKERIRQHAITDLRLPLELKTLENEGGLHPNPICSITIALFATDYFHWDEERKNENDIIKLAINISRYLQSDIKLNKLFQGKK